MIKVLSKYIFIYDKSVKIYIFIYDKSVVRIHFYQSKGGNLVFIIL